MIEPIADKQLVLAINAKYSIPKGRIMPGKNVELIDKSNNLYVETGAEMSLASGELNFSGKCTFVGQRRNQYIVVTPPPNFPALENKLRQDYQIQVKFLYKENIFEFSSRLKEIIYEPLMLLMLQYPVSIEKKEHRSHKRISCFISAEMRVNNEIHDGIIKDISKFGCRYVFEATGQLEKAFRIDDHVLLSFDFPGIFDRQEIMGTIKDIRRQESRLDVGIEFSSMAWWVPPYD